MPNIVAPDPSSQIVEPTGKMRAQFRRWVFLMSQLDPIVGTGSPEGVVEARQTRVYMDDAGTAGNILYVKRDDSDGLGDKSKGWILV